MGTNRASFPLFKNKSERIDQTRLDALLADDNIEIVGDLEFENEIEQADPLTGTPETAQLMYTNVRLRRKIDKSRVKIRLSPQRTSVFHVMLCL